MTDPDFNEQQILTFRALACVFLVLDVILLIFALHNLIRYLCRLRITKTLIVQFYATLITAVVIKVYLRSMGAIEATVNYNKDFISTYDTWSVIFRLAIVFESCTALIVFLTLH